jgi:hypothetical protein
MKKHIRHKKKSVKKASATKRGRHMQITKIFSSDWYAAMFALLLLGVSMLELAAILSVQLQLTNAL